MFELTFPRHGALLNRRHGTENKDGLTIVASGVCDSAGSIAVNGIPARRQGRTFQAEITIKECFNTITAELQDDFGRLSREIKAVWDRDSFLRYDFFIDDNIFFLTDLAREKPRSLFDHFYLKFLRKMHERYGTCFTLNLFFRNDHEPFDLTLVPDRWKGEFADHADWLKLSFHAYSEFPDRPYQNTPPEKLGADFDLVFQEVCRFAGEASFIPLEALHWAMARPSAFGELRKRGVRLLEGQFVSPRTGIADAGEEERITDVGYFRSHNDALYIEENRYLFDFRHRILFWRNDCTANLWSVDEIRKMVGSVTRDTIGLATHEQYSFPRYFNYLADHFERIETAIRTATERGYKPVFFHHGILGNQSWGRDLW